MSLNHSMRDKGQMQGQSFGHGRLNLSRLPWKLPVGSITLSRMVFLLLPHQGKSKDRRSESPIPDPISTFLACDLIQVTKHPQASVASSETDAEG
jgi:hypothetical protein